MKKYLFIFKSEVMSTLQYIFNTLFGYIGYLILLFCLLNVWKYIYSNPNEIINGYSLSQMIWYVIITELLWSILSGRKFCNRVIKDVKTGNITYNINKPYNYVLYLLFSHLGEAFLRSIFYTIFAVITGYIFIGVFPSLNIINIILILLTSFLATIISTLLIILISLFSFYIEDVVPFYWIYSKIILIIGTIFPIEYFPKILRGFLSYSPIYVVSYGPARLFVNFSYLQFISIFILQIIYILMIYSLCLIIYKKGVKKLNVNGG